MEYDPKSIAEQIECLARLTGAPDSFVDQVRELFARKGISLAEEATPYVKALEEAFVREESIRASTQRARQSTARLRTDFERIGKSYVEQIERLRRAQSGLHAKRSERRGTRPQVRSESLGPTVTGRNVVTRQQTEEMPMVPGPEELQ